MAEHANERIRIDASREECLAVVLDFESYPSWARDLKQVTITERDDDGRGRLVEFRAAAMGQSFKYVLAYDYTNLPESFSWVLDSGEKLRQLDGTYRFEPEDGGTAGPLRPRRRPLDPAARSHQAPRRRDDHGHRAPRAQEGRRSEVEVASTDA